MEELIFYVQGSSAEPYKVVFIRRSKTNLSAYCSCPAGENGLYCKHRLEILDGNKKSVVSSNADDVIIVQSWLSGTDVEKTLFKIRDLEKESTRIKAALSSAKKELAKAMRD
jgi:hypothetical protein